MQDGPFELERAVFFSRQATLTTFLLQGRRWTPQALAFRQTARRHQWSVLLRNQPSDRLSEGGR